MTSSTSKTVLIDLTNDKEEDNNYNKSSSVGQKRESLDSSSPTSKKLKSTPKSVEMHHPGELDEVNWDEGDYWCDWDHGPIETNYNRRECPDGFYWSCCGELGSAKGCTKGKCKFNEDLNVRYPDYNRRRIKR